MQIALLTLRFSLPGCRSLKEKRQRLGGLHQRFGRNVAVAVCESAEQDAHERSEWSFVVVSQTTRGLESICTDIERRISTSVDGVIVGVSREIL
jgi:uncharacterized protein